MSAKPMPLESVLPGTELADNVRDAEGRILLRSGSMLTESAIESLKRRGVESVVVDAGETDSEHESVRRAQLETRLGARFARAGKGEASRQLFQATLEYLMARGD